jgi:hypothetical protein
MYRGVGAWVSGELKCFFFSWIGGFGGSVWSVSEIAVSDHSLCGWIESKRDGAVVSHISRTTSEMWGTRPLRGNDLVPIRSVVRKSNQPAATCVHITLTWTSPGLGPRPMRSKQRL